MDIYIYISIYIKLFPYIYIYIYIYPYIYGNNFIKPASANSARLCRSSLEWLMNTSLLKDRERMFENYINNEIYLCNVKIIFETTKTQRVIDTKIWKDTRL